MIGKKVKILSALFQLSARVYYQETIGGVCHCTSKRLNAFYCPLLAAISREKFLLENPKYNSVRNDISVETLANLGFSSWSDVTLEKLHEIDGGWYNEQSHGRKIE